MGRENLAQVKEGARSVFLVRAPALLRFGEPVLRAVDAVTAYAYREGRRAEHEAHQDAHLHDERNRFVATFADNKGLLGSLLTLAVSATAAPLAAVAINPLIPPLLGWGLAVLAVLVLLVRALWSRGA